MLIDPHSVKADRRLNYLIVVCSVALGALLILAPTIVSTGDSTKASARTDELAACRAQVRADVDAANVQVTLANSTVQDAIAAGLVALVHDDDQALTEAVDQAETGRIETLAAVGVLADAVAAYSDAVTQAQQDPEGFLDQCRSANP